MEKGIYAIVDLLINRNMIKEKERETYLYGLKSIVYDMLLTIILLFIGAVMKMTKEAIIIIVVFYIFQTNGGGYHAKNHTLCISFMSFGMVISLLNIYIDSAWQHMLFFSALVILFCIPLVIHPKKKYLYHRSGKFIRRSQIITMIIVFILFIFYRIQLISFACITSALFFPAISRLTGRLTYRRYYQNDNCCL